MIKFFPMKKFLEQVDEIKKEFHLKNDRDFDRALGLTNKLYRWRKGLDKSVSMETLLLIREKFNKPLDWLLFGEEQPLQVSESRPKPIEVRPLSNIDFELANRIRCRIEDELARARKKLPEDLKLKLLIKIYNDCMEKHLSMEEIDINDYLWFLD